MTTIQQPRTSGLGTSTADPTAAEAVFLESTRQLLTPLHVRRGEVVADIGPGAGSATVLLAHAVGREGRVYAVDLDPAMLALTVRAADEAGVGDRVRPILHDLEGGPPSLPEAVDAIWSSACVHHATDWDRGIRALTGLLRPGGRLCLAEGGLPTRCLPWDVGLGRPGLETRLDAAHDQRFTDWFDGRDGARRPGRGWAEILTDAGLVGVEVRHALVDIPAPLPDPARAVVIAELGARVRRAAQHLDTADARSWSRLLDPSDPAWLGHRRDLALLTARSAFTGHLPPQQ